MRVPLGGGAPVSLAAAADVNVEPGGVVVDSTSAYWTSSTLDVDAGTYSVAVMKVPLGGGTATTLISGVPDTELRWEPLAIDSTSVYFTAGYAFLSVPIGGGSATPLPSTPGCFAAGATHVVWSQDIGSNPYIVIWNR
jgi:hypothetical protein